MKAGVSIRVDLDQADALGVGLSLVTIAALGKMPRETCEAYERVGLQLIAAARVNDVSADATAEAARVA